MQALVTGSAGHLGEALMRTLRSAGMPAVGLDIVPSPFTDRVGSIDDPDVVRACMQGVDVVYHTATLHKPHVATHSEQAFIDTNISGTRQLLKAAVDAGVRAFVFTSTTSTFGDALRPPPGEPAAWITEAVTPRPKNIYGVTKTAAEDLCRLYARNRGLACIVLRTSRFFPEMDDDPERRAQFSDANLKTNEFLYRRVELADLVSAHQCAAVRAPELGFGLYVVSATSPFEAGDVAELNRNARAVVQRRVPECESVYRRLGWQVPQRIDRVYVNDAARRDLGWRPRYDFRSILARLANEQAPQSALARQVGSKGYHDQSFGDQPYPLEAGPVEPSPC